MARKVSDYFYNNNNNIYVQMSGLALACSMPGQTPGLMKPTESSPDV
jgi:hypothetical protein